MNLKFEAEIGTGKLKIYEEHDIEKPLYSVSVETEDKEHYKMEVKGNADNLLGEVLYKEDIDKKWLMVNNYVINNLETGERINVTAERGKKLVIGEDMFLTRSIRDRKMLLYKNDKLIMDLKCKTLIRNWLKGEYTAEILDDSYALLCVCVILIALNVIFDEHNSTSYKV